MSALHWVKLSVYCQRSGDTVDGVRKRLRTGNWMRSVHVRQPEGSQELWVNELAVNDWAAGKQPTNLHGNGAK